MIKRNLMTTFLLFTLLVSTSVLHASGLPNFADLAEKAGPSVVNISTEQTSKGRHNRALDDFMQHVPPGFENFFKQFQPFYGNPREQKKRSLGTGFIISSDGYIVTNFHVVKGADVINVNLQGSTGKAESITAKLIGSDEETDIALLKVEVKDKNLPFLTFADSDKARVGEWVLAIGNPFGLEHTVTSGILSAKGRNINSGPFDNYLQTDASINPGNSGGPLLNMDGQVVGINTAIIASGQGIGFAIPSSMASNIAEQLKSGKKVSRGWMGISMQPVTENDAKALGLEKTVGALVSEVMEGEPAAKAGLKAGDVIIAVDDKNVEDPAALLRAIASQSPGSMTKVTVWRNGEKKDYVITLGERNTEHVAGQSNDSANKEKQETASLGISVRTLTAEEAKAAKVEKGQGLLVAEVAQGKPASQAGVRVGDIILTANMTPVNDAKVLAGIIQSVTKRGAVMLQIQRKGKVHFVAVPLSPEK